MICQILKDSTVFIRDDILSSGSNTDLTYGPLNDLANHSCSRKSAKGTKFGSELVTTEGKNMYKADSVGSV